MIIVDIVYSVFHCPFAGGKPTGMNRKDEDITANFFTFFVLPYI